VSKKIRVRLFISVNVAYPRFGIDEHPVAAESLRSLVSFMVCNNFTSYTKALDFGSILTQERWLQFLTNLCSSAVRTVDVIGY